MLSVAQIYGIVPRMLWFQIPYRQLVLQRVLLIATVILSDQLAILVPILNSNRIVD